MDWDSQNRERPAQFIQIHEPWQRLSHAIVKSACDDYKLYLGPGRKKIEKFFRSRYFAIICTLDPDYLIKTLQGEFKQRVVARNKK